MALGTKVVLRNAKLYYAELDISGLSNQVGLNRSQPQIDVTNFDSPGAFDEFLAGNKDFTVDVQGMWAGLEPDKQFWENDDQVPFVFSRSKPVVEGAAGLVYMLEAIQTQYNQGNPVKQVPTFSLQLKPNGGVGRGKCLMNVEGFSTTGDHATGETQLGAVPQGQEILIIAQALAVGTSIDLKIESASDAPFTTPTDRHVFTQFTVPGYQVARVKGPITDDYWRVNVTAAVGDSDVLVTAAII